MTHLKYLLWNKIRWILHIKSFLVLTPVFACISTNGRTALHTDESRIGLVTFNVSQMWFIAQAMSFLSVLAYFIINNGPFKYCLTNWCGSQSLAVTCWQFKPRTGHEWKKLLNREARQRHPRTPAESTAGQTQGSLHLSWHPVWSHPASSTAFSFWAAKLPNWVEEAGWRFRVCFSSRVKIPVLSSETHPMWPQLASIPPEFP